MEVWKVRIFHTLTQTFEAMVMSWPWLLLRAISGSMVLLYLGSMLISVLPSKHMRIPMTWAAS